MIADNRQWYRGSPSFINKSGFPEYQINKAACKNNPNNNEICNNFLLCFCVYANNKTAINTIRMIKIDML